MTTGDSLTAIGLLVSIAAAFFALKAWLNPRRPAKRTVPSLSGSALDSPQEVADFLLDHLNTIVQIHIEVGIAPTATPEPKMVFNNNVLELNYSANGHPHKICFQVFPHKENLDLTQRRTISLILEGAFVPSLIDVKDAARMEGTLTQVGPVELAQYLG